MAPSEHHSHPRLRYFLNLSSLSKSYPKILILFYAGMTITASASPVSSSSSTSTKFALFVLGKHHLCDALAIIDDEVLL